jgi:hypothetical protein
LTKIRGKSRASFLMSHIFRRLYLLVAFFLSSLFRTNALPLSSGQKIPTVSMFIGADLKKKQCVLMTCREVGSDASMNSMQE